MEQTFRCEKCGKLLAKYQTIECVKMEIKCPRCNLVNTFSKTLKKQGFVKVEI